jgi:uncharacterized membrane protein
MFGMFSWRRARVRETPHKKLINDIDPAVRAAFTAGPGYDYLMAVGRAMPNSNPRSTASLGGHPIHSMLVPIPIVCFLATLVTDIVYWRTAMMLWADMSAWLLLTGLIVSVFAASAGLIDFFNDRRIRELRSAWIHGLGNTVALILSIFNALIHTRDAYTSVVPAGLILSTLVVLILLVTGWNGWSMVYRHGVGVRQDDHP